MSQGPPNPGCMQEKVQKGDFLKSPHANWKIIFVLGSYKSLEHLVGYIRSGYFLCHLKICTSSVPRNPHLNTYFQTLNLSKNNFGKKCVPKLLSFIDKKIRKIWIILDVESSLWKSDFFTFWRTVSLQNTT